MKKISSKSFSPFAVRHDTRGAFRRIFRIPDTENIIERQRVFVFLYASLGYLIGIALNLITAFGPQSRFFDIINSAHATLILLLAGLYIRRLLSVYRALVLLILSIQIEISIEMVHMSFAQEGIILGVTGIMGNTILLGMALILSITAYIRYLPYLQTLITITTLGVCEYITKDPLIGHIIPVLMLAFCVLSFMGDRLVRGVASLQSSKDNLAKEQDRLFEFLNMNKDELFQLIRLTRRKKLSDRQKGRLLDLLDEQTKASVLEVAAEVVEKKKQKLTALDASELGLTPYEKEVCLLILQRMTIADIARKLKKSPTAITTIRGTIRSKLALTPQENLYEVLLKLVEADE